MLRHLLGVIFPSMPGTSYLVMAGCAGAQAEGEDEEVLDDKEIAEVEKADAVELGEGLEDEEEGVEMEEGADAADDDEEVQAVP